MHNKANENRSSIENGTVIVKDFINKKIKQKEQKFYPHGQMHRKQIFYQTFV